MRTLRKALAWFSIASLWGGSLFGEPSLALSQDPISCTATNIVVESCSTIFGVNVERGKPFVAESVSKSSAKSSLQSHLLARETSGRIRVEQQLPRSIGYVRTIEVMVSSDRDGKIMLPPNAQDPLVSSDAERVLSITIFDCFGGKSILLQPGPQTATVQQSCGDLPHFQQRDHPYLYRLTRFLGAKEQPDFSVEDLGYKKIGGIRARGVRITGLGTEKDGDWKGKPVKVVEEWMSDDLDVTLLWIYSDLINKFENRTTLTNIKRGEPDASLFQIPPEYKVTYWK